MISSPAVPTTEGASSAEEVVPLYVWLFLGGLVTSLFSGFTGLMGIPVPMDRLFFAAAIVLVLLDPTTRALRWLPVHWAMVAVVAWTLGSALMHGTLFVPKGMFALLDRIMVPFLMFLLGPLVFCTRKRRDMLLRTVVLIGIYLSITGFFEVVGPHSLVWPRYIMDESVGILFGRARGPFVSAEPNGMVMALSLFCAALIWARAPRESLWRVVALVAMPLSLMGVALAQTRSVWISTVAALVTIGIIVPRTRGPLIAGGLAALMAGALVFVTVPGVSQAADERVGMKSSIYDRQNTNAAALRIIAERPLFGVGWQKFIEVGPQYVRQDHDYPVSNINIEVHDVFLSRSAETGVLGGILWALVVLLGPVAVAFGYWRRRREDPELAAWTVLLVAALWVWLMPTLVSPNPYPLPNNLMWLIAGIAGSRELLAPRRPGPLPGGAPSSTPIAPTA